MALPVIPSQKLDMAVSSLRVDLATNTLAPIVFGESVVEGRVFAVHIDGVRSEITAGVLWSIGPQLHVDNVELNREAPLLGTDVTNYLGSATQELDDTLADLITNYADDLVTEVAGALVGFCYSVVKYSSDDYTFFPLFTATLGGVPGTSNPILAIKTLIEHSVYGLGQFADNGSFQSALDFHQEELIDDETDLSEQRSRIGLVIQNSLLVNDWIDVLSEYAQCWTYHQNGLWHITVDKPSNVTALITTKDIVAGSFVIDRISSDKIPNRIEVVYTDTHEDVTSDQTATAQIARHHSTPVRTSRITLPGIKSYSQAYREAYRRLRQLQHSRHYIFQVSERLSWLQIGDLVELDHDNVARVCRMVSVPVTDERGRIRVELTEYSELDYTDAVLARPDWLSGDATYIDNTVTSVSTVPEEMSAPMLRQSGLTVIVTWAEPGNGGSAITRYQLIGRNSSDNVIVNEVFNSDTLMFTTGDLEFGTYEFLTRARNANGYAIWSDESEIQIEDPDDVITTRQTTLREFNTGELFTAVFSGVTLGGNLGRWNFDSTGTTTSSGTGPGTNNTLSFVYTETSGSPATESVLSDNGIAIIDADEIPAGINRVFHLRVCIQGASFLNADEGLAIDTRDSEDVDWVEAGFQSGSVYPIANLVPNDTVTDADGNDLTVVANGGWLDIEVSIPDSATQIRLRPEYVFEPDDRTFLHDIALRSLYFDYDA